MHNRLDTLLDRTVLLGYGKPGLLLRRTSWEPLAPDALRGRTALITGANSGIGKAMAAGMAELGAEVTLVVRDTERGAAAAADITADTPGATVRVARCDISDLTDVRRFAHELLDHTDRVDILVHNAGVLPRTRAESPQGHEICLATHVLGPLLATELLAPALERSGAGRVILVSSGGMYSQPLPVQDIEYRTGDYHGATAYARTKRIQVALTPKLAERYAAQHISVHSMHPGWVDTPGVATSLPRFRRLTGPLLRTPAEGADTALWLAATEVPPGHFWHDRRIRPEHYLPRTRTSETDREYVWQYCTNAAGFESS
ncbi:SDR family NAD(P)-dependent oxidoreductase [Nocardia sp. NBC_01503]|uniref:SDR family NAD(P)-dependent oxidoreductase n=1 Tax=Nocardia sp. NBC_01503 TaxID=2975997 RepID=UPI002E7B7B96|nr:SDR family NAD(P)-dependent oxidoreductase [Nocardia sp. NBC_01503]WTL30609.1 SDR family NAD(P)-dependent oxidoreductase [Nocardia sp. NBC_01503]